LENSDWHYNTTFYGWDMLENTLHPLGIFWIEYVRKHLMAMFWIINAKICLVAAKHFQDWKW
jgi:hypothetical protein